MINANGMGKDLPGSPITTKAIFPERGIAWELNHRGELDFLRQAQTQAEKRQLQIVDGQYYFLAGWAQAVSRVFEVEIDATGFERLRAAAETVRSG